MMPSRSSFDLIILQIVDGLADCLRDVERLHRRYPRIPIFVIAEQAPGEIETSLIEAGADEVFDADQLDREHLERSILRAVLRAKRRQPSPGEERAGLAVRGTDAGIWDRDLRTNEVYFSPRWKSMLGYADDQIENKFSEWEDRIHPEDRQRVLEAIRNHVEGRTLHYRVEYRLRHADGSYRWILSQGGAVRDEQGRPYRIVGLHFDITERKEIEDSLREEQRLLRDVLGFLESDRKLIGHEIHDGFVQEATGAIFHLEAARSLWTNDPIRAAKEFETGVRLVKESVKEARRLISGLRPPILDEAGVVAAIEYLVEEARQQASVEISFSQNVSSERFISLIETAVFRIIQEGLNNARRHSRSSRILVELLRLEDSLHIEIQTRRDSSPNIGAIHSCMDSDIIRISGLTTPAMRCFSATLLAALLPGSLAPMM